MSQTAIKMPNLDKRLKGNSLEAKQKRIGYFFLSPFILGAAAFVVYPLVMSVLYSFGHVDIDPENVSAGLRIVEFTTDHYKSLLLEDINYRQMVLTSLSNMAVNVPVVVMFAFFIASVLNTKFIGRGAARSIMFMPVIISSGIVVTLGQADLATRLMQAADKSATASSTISVATAFESMLINMNLGGGVTQFLIDSVNRISTITTLSAVSIVIFLAGLQSISNSIYEASYIEGATKWEVFWKISLPMVSPMILLSVIYTVIESFTDQSNRLMQVIHTNFLGTTKFDISSAMVVTYSAIILLILGIIYFVFSKFVFYYD